MEKHSELPWTLGWGEGLTGPTTPSVHGPTVAGRNYPYSVISQGYRAIAIVPQQDDKTENNAALIVRAVNAHQSLIDALESLLPGAEAMGWSAAEQARAALARAKGEA